MPPARPDRFLFLTTTTSHKSHPLFLISPSSIYSSGSLVIECTIFSVSAYVTGLGVPCLAPSSRRVVSSPRHGPPSRRVLLGPLCTLYLTLFVFRNLHSGIDIALNRIETLIIKSGTFGYSDFGIATHCTANRLGPLRYLFVDLISPWTSLLNLAASSTRSSNHFKPPAMRSLSISRRSRLGGVDRINKLAWEQQKVIAKSTIQARDGGQTHFVSDNLATNTAKQRDSYTNARFSFSHRTTREVEDYDKCLPIEEVGHQEYNALCGFLDDPEGGAGSLITIGIVGGLSLMLDLTHCRRLLPITVGRGQLPEPEVAQSPNSSGFLRRAR
ncbi:uncharacterized protein LACBIDRAFT_327447 [Laccaria bicolor S238N-H82]|uniref:Predicted protein n=1 Tax=Laccaria bicolor (strain S238N-H82 / ATCC MYA-4686) TaxID=486041 RepID=B0DB39_LACBS|nr:uncharacterized protein LACBIDRAFT_327447 [Laccaria bicolor S238N-H82]EDR08320.1 predicted protein [Laccaria bicolor S238N-H82]|eukprot:XP_001881390.1 predicted protein [Laccaria bicolor S238N-H82]